jgi:hypothetical protein
LKEDSRYGKVIVPNPKLGLANRSVCFRGSTDWNSRPSNIRNARKIGEFKRGLKKWVMENITRFT